MLGTQLSKPLSGIKTKGNSTLNFFHPNRKTVQKTETSPYQQRTHIELPKPFQNTVKVPRKSTSIVKQ